MKRYSLIIVILTLAFPNLWAQETLESYIEKNNIQTKSTRDGLLYEIKKKGSSGLPEAGDYVAVTYEGKLLTGETFDETGNEPLVFQIGFRQVIKGLDLGVRLIGEGGKINLYIPSHLGYGDFGAGDLVPPGAALLYEVEVAKILSPQEYDKYMIELENKEKEEYEKQVRKQLSEDIRMIEKYSRENNLKPNRLPSGLHYVITKPGKGPKAEEGSTVKIQYEAFFTDGTLFDSTIERDTPFSFTIGRDKLITGMEEGLKQFNKGSEGWLLIPSGLAYGPEPVHAENLTIPAHAVLIFKIRVIDLF